MLCTQAIYFGRDNTTWDLLQYLIAGDPGEGSVCSCPEGETFPLKNGIHIHCTEPLAVHSFIEFIYSLLFYVIIVLSVVGNFIVIWIVLYHERMRTVTNYYLLNLAIADSSNSILNTGFTWHYMIYYNWRWGSTYCHVNNFMGVAPITASVFTMIVMSIDRYWAVVHPLRKRPGKRATVTVIITIWVIVLTISTPAALASHMETHFFIYNKTVHERVVCLSDNFIDGDSQTSSLFFWYTNLLFVVQYALPLSVLSYTYWKVGGVLRKKESVGDIRHYRSIAAKRKASKMLALVVFIFMVVWLPYHSYFLYESFVAHSINLDPELSHKLYINVYFLGMTYSIFNPIIYYFMNKRFRMGFKYVFRFLPCVSVDQMEYECQLGSCPRGPSLPSYHSTSHTHTIANTKVTDF